jgi:hypothetical protein
VTDRRSKRERFFIERAASRNRKALWRRLGFMSAQYLVLNDLRYLSPTIALEKVRSFFESGMNQ